MRILVYGINYFPECVGIGKYSSEMCEWLASKGHIVHVITAMPYYPSWSVMKEYRGKLWHTEIIGSVNVHRCPLYVTKRVSGLSRIFQEVSFVLSSLVYWSKYLFSKFDVT